MIVTTPAWNAQGQPQVATQAISGLAGLPALQRSFGRTFYASGAVSSAYYFDAVGAGTSATTSQMHLDAKGLPSSIDVMPGSSAASSIFNVRNVAGLVVTQESSGGLPAWPIVSSSWTYDSLGRVAGQHVFNGSVTTPRTGVAGQDLSYFGNDEPKTLDQYLPSGHKQFSLSYDLRHQLLSAGENTTSGYFSSTYSYGLAGRFAHATEASSLPPGSDVKPRNVAYQYASAGANSDPEEISGLVNTDGSSFAQFEYDAIGNLTYRCNGRITTHNAHDHSSHVPDICVGDSMHLDYDGKDQLRRVISMRNNAVVGSEEYWYDEGGRRVVTVKLDNHGNKTEEIWWLGDAEAHYDGSGTVTHVFSYVSMGGAVARIDRVADTQTNIEYAFHGLGGSTLAAVDRSTGNVNVAFGYAPFGELVEATDSSGGEGVAAHRRRFNDKFEDEISELTYYGARYYDKETMTWTQGDPLFRFAPDAAWTDPRRAMLYTHELNNPLRYVDPDGRDPSLTIIVSDVSNTSSNATGKEGEKFQLAQTAVKTVEKSYSNGGNGNAVIKGASRGRVGTTVTTTPANKANNRSGKGVVHVFIVDLSDKASRDLAAASGAGGLVKDMQRQGKQTGATHALAQTQGRNVVIAIDREQEKAHKERLSVGDPRVAAGIDRDVTHEVNHVEGANDTEKTPPNSDTGKPNKMNLMNEDSPDFTDYSDEGYNPNLSSGDMTDIENGLNKEVPQ
jgi:RHS repeat-associated protein